MKKNLIIALTLFAAALALKVLVLSGFDHSIFSGTLVLDMADYDKWGMNVAGGRIIGNDVFYGLPFYPYFLGFVYFLFGHSILAVKIIQILMGSLSCVMVYFLGKRLFGTSTGVLSAVIMMFYKELYFYEMLLLPTTFGVFLYLAIALLALNVFSRPCIRDLVLLGVLTGIGVLSRAYMLMMVPVIAVFLWRLKGDPGKNKTRNTAVFIAAALMVISLAGIHNYLAAKDFVPLTAHGGINFYVGNNPASDGSRVKVPFATGTGSKELIKDMGRIAEQKEARSLKPSEVSSFWTGEAVKFMTGRPFDFAGLLLKKISLFFCGAELTDILSYRLVASAVPVMNILFFGYAAIVPFAFAGIFLTFLRKKELVFIYTVIAAHILSIILFLVVGRYRLAIAPFFMIFAAAFFPAFYKTVRSGKLSSAGGAVAVAVVSFLYLNNPALSRNNVSFGSSYLFVGGYYYDNKDFDKAVEFFKKTVELEPGRAEGHNMLGLGLSARGDYTAAIDEFRTALSINPGMYQAMINLGYTYEKMGRYKDAIDEYQAVLAVSPGQENVKRWIAELKIKTGM